MPRGFPHSGAVKRAAAKKLAGTEAAGTKLAGSEVIVSELASAGTKLAGSGGVVAELVTEGSEITRKAAEKIVQRVENEPGALPIFGIILGVGVAYLFLNGKKYKNEKEVKSEVESNQFLKPVEF